MFNFSASIFFCSLVSSSSLGNPPWLLLFCDLSMIQSPPTTFILLRDRTWLTIDQRQLRFLGPLYHHGSYNKKINLALPMVLYPLPVLLILFIIMHGLGIVWWCFPGFWIPFPKKFNPVSYILPAPRRFGTSWITGSSKAMDLAFFRSDVMAILKETTWTKKNLHNVKYNQSKKNYLNEK